MTTETFGQRLKRVREEKSITQKDIAFACDISAQAISNYEVRGDEPSASLLFSIAHVLGVDPRWLYDGQGSEKTNGTAYSADVLQIANAIRSQSVERRHALAVLLGVDFTA